MEGSYNNDQDQEEYTGTYTNDDYKESQQPEEDSTEYNNGQYSTLQENNIANEFSNSETQQQQYDNKSSNIEENSNQNNSQVQSENQNSSNIQNDQNTSHKYGSELENDVVVYVVDPVVKDNVRNFIVYTIKGQDKDGSFEIIRRFSDFYSLKYKLQERWPGCYIPPTPSKKVVGNFDHQFVEDRRKQLQTFMQKLSDLKHLWYSEEMKIFLRTSCSDVDSALSTLPKTTYDSLIKKYESSFSFLSGREINTEVIIKISSFTNFIKKQQAVLENYKIISKNMIKERQAHNQQLDLFTSFMLPEYEKNSLSEYLDQDTEGKLIFHEQESEKLNDIQIKLKDYICDTEIEEIYEMLRYETRELESFQETMNVRGNYESLKAKSLKKKQELNEDLSRLMSNKTTIKGLFSSKSKNEQIQTVQNKLEIEDKNIANLTLICEIMTVILGYVEIDRFRQEKEQIYYNTIRNIARHELNFQKTQMELWNTILENKNVL